MSMKRIAVLWAVNSLNSLRSVRSDGILAMQGLWKRINFKKTIKFFFT